MNRCLHDHLLAKQFFHQTFHNIFNDFNETNIQNFYDMCYSGNILGTRQQYYYEDCPVTKRKLIGYVLTITIPKSIRSQFKTNTRVYVSTSDRQFITRHNTNTELHSPLDGDLNHLLNFRTAYQSKEAPFNLMVLDIDLPYTQDAVADTLKDINETLSNPNQFTTDDGLKDRFGIEKTKPSNFLLNLEKGH